MHIQHTTRPAPGELRAERAYQRRRIAVLQRAERALRRAERDLAAAGDRDHADLLFISWNDGAIALDKARECLAELSGAAT